MRVPWRAAVALAAMALAVGFAATIHSWRSPFAMPASIDSWPPETRPVSLAEAAEASTPRSIVTASAPAPSKTTDLVVEGAPDAPKATLTVVVRAAESGLPVAGSPVCVGVVANMASIGRRALSTSSEEYASVWYDAHASALADRDGRATFRVPVRRELQVLAGAEPDGLDAIAFCDNASAWIEPLEPSAERAVSLDVSSSEAVVYWCRVLAPESDRPVEGLDVQVWDRGRVEVRAQTDAQGFFRAEVADPFEPIARVTGRGRSPARVAIARGFPSRDAAQVVRVARAASLEVELVDPNGRAMAGCEVRAMASSSEMGAEGSRHVSQSRPVAWKSVTDERGRCSFDTLPARIDLDIEAGARPAPMYRSSRAIRIEPATTHHERCVVAVGRIDGQFVDADGAPIARHDIGLQRQKDVPFEMGTLTDDAGRFTFDVVPGGTWWVSTRTCDWSGSGCLHLPVSERVRLTADQPRVDVLMQAARGEFVEGLVFARGGVAEGASVHAETASGPRRAADAKTDANGAFRVGPLPAGNVTLTAWAPGYRRSSPVTEVAGSTDVRLDLLPGAALVGTIRDARTGASVAASVWMRSDRQPRLSEKELAAFSGPLRDSFEFGGLEDGEYFLFASTPDGRAAHLGPIELHALERKEGLELRVGSAARLRVVSAPMTNGAEYELYAGGTRLHDDWLVPGESKVHIVPAGKIEIHVTGNETPQWIDAVAGQTSTFVVPSRR
ncbi:MAG TPA: carboxypeptidase-like regulatory domain-containing protein [Planctomycetota bacterium]|nr:carboxypeptidase-like regulatory domain-containing protein [Planctomycetota bacterium]